MTPADLDIPACSVCGAPCDDQSGPTCGCDRLVRVYSVAFDTPDGDGRRWFRRRRDAVTFAADRYRDGQVVRPAPHDVSPDLAALLLGGAP